MKKRKVIITLLKTNTPSSPSEKAKAEALLHVILNVHNSGAGTSSNF